MALLQTHRNCQTHTLQAYPRSQQTRRGGRGSHRLHKTHLPLEPLLHPTIHTILDAPILRTLCLPDSHSPLPIPRRIVKGRLADPSHTTRLNSVVGMKEIVQGRTPAQHLLQHHSLDGKILAYSVSHNNNLSTQAVVKNNNGLVRCLSKVGPRMLLDNLPLTQVYQERTVPYLIGW